MKTLIESTDCYDLVYHDLDWALMAMDQLPELQSTP
jgi:hypothetical protein